MLHAKCYFYYDVFLHWLKPVGGALNSKNNTECCFIMTHFTKRIEPVMWPYNEL